jgi:hypothetical protein
LFQLLTLPWVRELPAAALKSLLVAAAKCQYKAMFHWLLQQPQAPKDDAEVQDCAERLRLSACDAEDRNADLCSYVAHDVLAGPPLWEPDFPEASDSESYDEMGLPLLREVLSVVKSVSLSEWSRPWLLLGQPGACLHRVHTM